MKIYVAARLAAPAKLALESSILDNRSNRPAGEEGLLFNAVKIGNVPADPLSGSNSVSIRPLIAAGDNPVKVGSEDRILQLVQQAGLKDTGMKVARLRQSGPR
jgi:hypothetical protein